MKRLLSIFLICSIIFTSYSSAYYAGISTRTPNSPKVSVFIAEDDGTYTLCHDNAIPVGDNVIYAESTDDEQTYHIKENIFLIQAYDNQFIPADQITINTMDYASNNIILSEYQIPKEIAEEIQKDIDAQHALGNYEFEVSILAPHNSNNPQTSDIIAPCYNADSWWESEYSFRTHRLKKYVTKYTNASTPSLGVENSAEASTIANEMTQLLIAVAGVFNQPISIFGACSTALEFFLYLTGMEEVSGGDNDEMTVKVWYDKRKERTFVYNSAAGGWSAGCEADKVWLNYAAIAMYFDGESKLEKSSINKTYYTPKYNDSSNTAVDNFTGYGHVDSPIRIKIARYQAVL